MADEDLFEDLLLAWEELKAQGRPTSPEELCRDCPELLALFRARIAALESMAWLDAELNYREATSSFVSSEVSRGDHAKPADQRPEQVGRYRTTGVLGSGGFGIVYKGYDDQLDRQVAIKVPRSSRFRTQQDVDSFLREARALAALDHPGIVPVFDVGRIEDGRCYVVSKFVEGTDLARKAEFSRPSHAESALIIARVAEALHHAHLRGLVHRDVKPGNILVDREGKPYLADFGLALREEEFSHGPGFIGTPWYMSPEQARGEGHRVDGRSDIFSLGVVFYELLTGRRPFWGTSVADLLDQIKTREPRPPRQADDRIPKELERICLKALSKRSADRYSTAMDMAEDLRNRLEAEARTPGAEASRQEARISPTGTTAALTPTAAASTPHSSSRLVEVIPKGLRPFDAEDAGFYLDLLPGPRDRDGLPDSIRFWKNRIEETDADRTFNVGLIFGPSGCGKSSLVRAGLAPRLAHHVIPVFVEAAPEQTESRLLRELRKRCGDRLGDLGLVPAMAAVRRGQAIPCAKKVLIVLDQIEQWLHAKRDKERVSLVEALRQCDGGRLQCILLVRDDFAMAAARLMQELEIRIVQGENFATVDLFELSHARKVLASFGRAFGRLPEPPGKPTADQNRFLDAAVEGLARGDKIVCVRLALFAEMVKARPWTPATLKSVGGAEGVGAAFLEEAFSSRTANPEYRLHQQAARAVLRALLPNAETDIKGPMRSRKELLEASRYGERPKEFEDLLRILDHELRLITPTERPEEVEREEPRVESRESRAVGRLEAAAREIGHGADVAQSAGESPAPGSPPSTPGCPALDSRLSTLDSFYQLTHDYLVPSLRKWLTRKQQETMRGRAELRLAERSESWNAKPEARHLPSLREYLRISMLTDRRDWTPSQHTMMARAGRVHGMRWGTGLLLALVVAVTLQQIASSVQYRNLKGRVQTTVAAMSTSRGVTVPYAIRDLTADGFHPDMVLNELRSKFSEASESGQLGLAYALAHFGDVRVDYLVEQIKAASPTEAANILAALEHSSEDALRIIYSAAKNSDDRRDWRYKTRLAMVAQYLGDGSLVRAMCQLDPDPIQRTAFIDEASSWYVDLERLSEIATKIEHPDSCSALCLAVGQVSPERWALTPHAAAAWEPVLADWYQHRPEPGTHGAAGWAMRQLHLALPAITPRRQPAERFGWHVNSLGMTMLRVPAGSFVRQAELSGATNKQNGIEQKVLLTQAFLLSDREVSIGLFRQFVSDPDYPDGEKPKDWEGEHQFPRAAPDHPVQQVSWYDAVLFCNWLSRRCGLQPCYKRTGEKEKTSLIRDGRLAETECDAWQLDATANGYRLPSEAEWEYACRAQTTTRFSSGDDKIDAFAAYGAFAPDACGSKLPNGWGLFDMHGNVWEWCHEWHGPYEAHVRTDDPPGPSKGSSRVVRGGSWTDAARGCWSSHRQALAPSSRNNNQGFRVARTADILGLRVLAIPPRPLSTASKPAGEPGKHQVGLDRHETAGNQAEYRILGAGEPFVIKDVQGGVQVAPLTGKAPAVVTVIAPDRKTRQFSFVVRQTDTGQAVAASGLLFSSDWDVKFYAWKPADPKDMDPANWEKVVANPPVPSDWDKVVANPPLDQQKVARLDFNWGEAAPSAKVPADFFAVVATTEIEMPAGRYDLWADAGDGARVFIDGHKMLDLWSPSVGSLLIDVELSGGKHTVRVEYFEIIGPAKLAFGIRPSRVNEASAAAPR